MSARVVRTIKNGALKIEVRRYADGRFGFDWQAGLYDRRKVRLHSQVDAEAKAGELLNSAQAGKLELHRIDPREYAEFLRWQASKREARMVPDVAAAFLAAKETKGRAFKTMKGLRFSVQEFARAFPVPLDEVTGAQVEAWLNARKVGPRRWNNLLADLVSLVRYARRDGALSTELHPIEKLERQTVTNHVTTYTPEELAAILAACPVAWLPTLVLGAFAGLRPEELAPEDAKPGLTWENILWSKAKVDVPAAVCKTRRRRFAPLTENALAWLAPWRAAKGPVRPGVMALVKGQAPTTRFCRVIPAIAKASGVAWKARALRHSFASYRLALTKDVPALALEMGNSPAMIFKHYLDLKHEDEALRYFGLLPVESGRLVAFTACAS